MCDVPVQSPTCVFVIIGFNNEQLTRECIESFRLNLPAVSLWLYDNASSPSLGHLAEQFRLPYLYSATNLGFAGGANRAIDWILQEASPSILCLVNNDTVLPVELARALQPELSTFMEDPQLAAMTPLLYKDRELHKPENFGIFYYQSGLAFQNRTGELGKPVLLNGAFLFLKATVCRQLLLEDGWVLREMYFFNAEDVELSLRLLSRGFTLRVNPALVVQHLGSQASKSASVRSFRLAWRNLLWTVCITRSRSQLLRDAVFILAGQVIMFGLSLLRGHPEVLFHIGLETFRSRHQLHTARGQFLSLKTHEFGDFMRPGVF